MILINKAKKKPAKEKRQKENSREKVTPTKKKGNEWWKESSRKRQAGGGEKIEQHFLALRFFLSYIGSIFLYRFMLGVACGTFMHPPSMCRLQWVLKRLQMKFQTALKDWKYFEEKLITRLHKMCRFSKNSNNSKVKGSPKNWLPIIIS